MYNKELAHLEVEHQKEVENLKNNMANYTSLLE